MWGRLQVWLAIALCLAIFITFLAHKPACSSGDMLHNRPVAKFKALSADSNAKSGISAAVEIALTRPVAAAVAPQLEVPPAAGEAFTLQSPGPQVLSCCLLC
ncbi:MAG: hypothetical protein ACHP78_09805 [Terriglobales bacterium]